MFADVAGGLPWFQTEGADGALLPDALTRAGAPWPPAQQQWPPSHGAAADVASVLTKLELAERTGQISADSAASLRASLFSMQRGGHASSSAGGGCVAARAQGAREQLRSLIQQANQQLPQPREVQPLPPPAKVCFALCVVHSSLHP